jgi:LacI family transcriptional regulator
MARPVDMKNRRQVAVIPQIWQNFDRGILKGIAAYVRECCNWSVFVEEIEHQRLPDLRSTHFDGFIVNYDSRSVAQALRGVTVPIVGYGGGGGWHDPASGVPYVATDDEAIGRLAAEHLLDRGLSQFGFCGYPQNRTNSWMEVRKRAFVGRLEQSGHECHVYCGRHSTASQWWKIQAGLCHWLRELPLPVGLMGCYDYRARHVLEACKTIGLRVPDDVALIGVDNDLACDLTDPPLSSIEQGRFGIGYTAAASLDKLMSGADTVPSRQVIAPVGLVPRQSTDVCFVSNPIVAEALRRIRDEACRGLGAGTLAEQAGLSRNTLDKYFKQTVGRSIDQEIRRIRIARAQELLTRTKLPLADVAARAGFGSEQYLSAVFSKQLGCTPARYRMNHRQAGLEI